MTSIQKTTSEHFLTEGDLNNSTYRRRWIKETLDETTLKLLKDDARYFLHQGLSTPCLDVVRSCKGIHLETQRGTKVMDFHGNSVHQVGYANPRVMRAIREQMDELVFSPRRFTNLPAIRLARKLVELAPGDLNRVLFAPGGTTVLGIALKLARAATGRFKTISLWDSFHGASLDSISISGEAIFRKDIGPLLPGCEHAPPPDPSHCVFGCKRHCNLRCADYIEYILEKEGDVAAVIAEPIRAAPFIPPIDYWKKVSTACRRHGALLILDEIPTCLGRTGTMFAFEHYGIIPDIVCIGKGLGGGIFPFAAMLAREELNNAHPDRALGHYTHEKNPVACAAALATLEEIEELKLLDHVNKLGTLALERMSDMMTTYPFIGEVRGIGLQLGIELVHERQTMKKHTIAAENVMYRALSKGLSFKISLGNVLTLTPPLIIQRDELEHALDILDECFDDWTRGNGSR